MHFEDRADQIERIGSYGSDVFVVGVVGGGEREEYINEVLNADAVIVNLGIGTDKILKLLGLEEE